MASRKWFWPLSPFLDSLPGVRHRAEVARSVWSWFRVHGLVPLAYARVEHDYPVVAEPSLLLVRLLLGLRARPQAGLQRSLFAVSKRGRALQGLYVWQVLGREFISTL